MKYVRKIFGFLDPLPPLVRKFTQPPLLTSSTMSTFGVPPSPPPGADVLYVWPLIRTFEPRMNPRVQVGYCVDIIELGICHIEIHFGIASQFVIYNESVFNSLHSHQKYVVSLYFCLPNTKFNSSKCRDRISSCRE